MNFDILKANSAVLTVGGGRGFVIEDRRGSKVIVTAAHCLPNLPPALGGITDLWERTYAALLGPLGSEPSVSAECLFADPVGDIAVLGTPDTQDLHEEAADFDELVAMAQPLTMADAPADGVGWLLALQSLTLNEGH